MSGGVRRARPIGGSAYDEAAVAALPREPIRVRHRAAQIVSRRWPPDAHGARRPTGCLLNLLAGVFGALDAWHGRTGVGAPGSPAERLATAAADPVPTHLVVTDLRLVLLRVEPGSAAGGGHLVLRPVFDALRFGLRAQQRRWWLNAARLRLDFPDGSWTVLDVETVWPTGTAAREIAAAISAP